MTTEGDEQGKQHTGQQPQKPAHQQHAAGQQTPSNATQANTSLQQPAAQKPAASPHAPAQPHKPAATQPGSGQKPPQPIPAGQKPAQPATAPKPAMQKPQPKPVAKDDDFRGIVRIVGKDVDGNMPLYKALTRVRGVGSNLARILQRVILAELSLDPKIKVGKLSEQQIEKVDAILKNPGAHGVRSFQLNHSKDFETGEDRHLLMVDLDFANKQNVQREKDLRSWKGFRYSLGQPVRGQHTRTTGRRGLTVGVLKKAIKEQKAAAARGGAAAAPAAGKEAKK